MEGKNYSLAIAGGGPAGLFMLKSICNSETRPASITVFEKGDRLGAGFPYNKTGSEPEHVTNVSDNEIPEIVTPISEWIKTIPAEKAKAYCIDPENFNEYKVLPRLLFGDYLESQFDLVIAKAESSGIEVIVKLNTDVTDVCDEPDTGKVLVVIEGADNIRFDKLVICTGHRWLKKYEGIYPNCFDSPYPPSKLKQRTNYPVALKGASLTAIDAIKTLARANGKYAQEGERLVYKRDEESPAFELALHSLHGNLPAVRFHLEDTHLQNDDLLSDEELKAHMDANDGFLSLDFFFEQNFKQIIKKHDPTFYERIKEMNPEQFGEEMMRLREELDPFMLLKAEYKQAEKSIERHQSIYWKELLGTISFALNYPAKHMSAEDFCRFQKSLSPIISLVIAYVPQGSVEELMALHDAGVLSLHAVEFKDAEEPLKTGGVNYCGKHYPMFVSCLGQPRLEIKDFPFASLREAKSITPAQYLFRSAEAGERMREEDPAKVEEREGLYYLRASGISINDNFQILDQYGAANPRIYMMAVPYIGGYNPDFSGLDFCEEAGELIAKNISAVT